MLQASFTRIAFMLKVVVYGRMSLRIWSAALVAVWLTQATGNFAWGLREIDWLNSPIGENLEAVGRIVEKPENTELIFTGKKRAGFPSPFEIVVFGLLYLSRPVGFYTTVPVPPANNAQNASGSGLNLNNDGSCIVGYQDSGFFTVSHAFRWTQASGAVDLGTLDPQNNADRSSIATDTNQDCSVVVGISAVTAGGATEHAFRWTSAGMVDLGVPAGGGPNSRAFGATSNGTVIVGDADFPDAGSLASGKSLQAFRWTQSGGFQNLNDSPQPTLSLATAVTGDGTVVVGQVRTSNNASSAVRWTFPPPLAQPVMQPIAPLSGHATAAATGVSDNGKIVVGISNPDFLQYRGPVLGWGHATAFRWTQAKGTQDLRQILSDSGVDMTGIELVSVTGMSRDGQYIQGAATTPETRQIGQFETVAYLAHFCDADIGGPCTTGAGNAPFTLGAAPNQITVSAGQSGSTTITVTPDAGFNQPVTFSCGGLPTGAACSFDPATVTPPGTVSTTLRITTNGGAVAMSSGASPTMFALLWTPLALGMTGMLWYRRSALQDAMKMSLLVFVVVAIASCSSSDSPPPADNSSGGAPTGTPAGTSTVTVTASSGGNSSGVPVTLTVTRP